MPLAKILEARQAPGVIWDRRSRGMERSHRHEELEMNLVRGGRATYLLGRERIELAPRSLVWFFPDEEHLLVETTPDFRMWLGIWQPDFPALLAREGGPAALAARRGLVHHRRLPAVSFEGLSQLCEAVSSSTPAAAQAAHRFLLHRAWQLFGESPSEAGTDVHPAVARAASILQEEQDLSVGELARRLELTPDHLGRLFRKQLGLSLGEYRTRERLLRVRERVSLGGADLTAAALASGFGSYSAFYRAWKRAHGESPLQVLGRPVAPQPGPR